MHADTSKCDVWSIGVIAHMLLSGTPPFAGRNELETLQSVLHCPFDFDMFVFRNVSTAARDFILQCLTRCPRRRPSARAALTHRWFQSLQRSKEEQLSLQLQQVPHTALSSLLVFSGAVAVSKASATEVSITVALTITNIRN